MRLGLFYKKSMRFLSRALTLSQHGPPLQVLKVKHIPLELSPNSMMLKILAAPVNPSDINMVEGTYPMKPKWQVLNDCYKHVMDICGVGEYRC